VSFHGNPLTLIGRVLKLGHIAPDFKAVTQDLKEVSLSEFKGQIKVISSFPSLDTPVCDLQVKEFNRRAAGFSSDVVVLGISKDLPFAQKRFCQENDIKNEVVLSDYKFSSFGLNYGLLIKELNLLARAVVILDKSDVLRYLQIVDDLTHSIDYENVLVSLKEVSANPALSSKENLPTHCRPCEGGMPPMPKEKIERLLASHRGWQLIEDKEITKEFKFKDFVEAKYFFDLIALLAEEQGHHPTMTISYNRLKVTLTTHAVGGLSDNDFIMARIIDELGT
jgi:thiol peroxidase